MKIQVKANVTLPRMPNFLIMEGVGTFGVETFSDEDLQRIGEAWTKELIAHAHRRRAKAYAPGEK